MQSTIRWLVALAGFAAAMIVASVGFSLTAVLFLPVVTDTAMLSVSILLFAAFPLLLLVLSLDLWGLRQTLPLLQSPSPPRRWLGWLIATTLWALAFVALASYSAGRSADLLAHLLGIAILWIVVVAVPLLLLVLAARLVTRPRRRASRGGE